MAVLKVIPCISGYYDWYGCCSSKLGMVGLGSYVGIAAGAALPNLDLDQRRCQAPDKGGNCGHGGNNCKLNYSSRRRRWKSEYMSDTCCKNHDECLANCADWNCGCKEICDKTAWTCSIQGLVNCGWDCTCRAVGGFMGGALAAFPNSGKCLARVAAGFYPGHR